MGRPEDPTQPDPAIDRTRTPAQESAEPTETRGYDHSAPPETSELPAIPGYDLLGELGRGGIGIVYKALQVALNRTVAVKLVVGTSSIGTLIRFRQEAEAVAKLQHPNIVQVFEVGACAAGSFLVLEYVDGGTLKDKVAGVPQPPREAARMAETLARAVHHAHDRRLVHRDLKPSNVLMTAGGVPKIADFGLAPSLDAGGGVTVTTDFVGTPAYAAPEQINPQVGAVGPATDVYALGVVLYELITGRLPFEAETIPQVLRMVAEEEPVPPRRLKRDCPRDLETICLKCLQKDPRKRYAGAAELADDLRRFVAGEPITARPVGVLERTASWAKRHPGVAALLGTVAVLLTAVAVVATVAAIHIDDARRKADTNAHAAKQSAEDEAKAKQDAERDRDAARRAEHEGKEKLLQSLISEAKASRYSRRVGQRFGTLDAVRKAAVLARELGKPPATFDELRNLAIAALALPDMKADTAWFSYPTDIDNTWTWPTPDPDYRRAAIAHQTGAISVRRLGAGPDDCGEIARLPVMNSEVSATWSPDGRHLLTHYWQLNRVVLQRMDGPRPEVVLEVPNGCLGAIFTPDGRQVVVIETGRPPANVPRALVHDVATGKAERSIPLPIGSAGDVSHHPHRSELAIRVGGGVALIDLVSGKQTSFLPVFGADHLMWHPQGELLAVTTQHAIEIWNVQSRRRNWQLEHTNGGVQVSFNRTGDLMSSAGWNGRIRLWNPHTGREILTVIGFGFFGTGDRLTLRFPSHPADAAHPLTVVEPGREYRTLPLGVGMGNVNEITPPSLHPDGRLVAVPMSAGFSLLDLATGTERAFALGGKCRAASFEPDGSLLISTNSGLYRWPVVADRGDPNRLTVGPPELVPVGGRGEAIGHSTDGTVLACPGGTGGVVWRRDRPHDFFDLPHSDCRHASISPSGKLVATGSWSGRGIKVWEAETGRLVRTLVPDQGSTMPTFSADGEWLAESRGQRWRVADWSEGPKRPSGAEAWRYSPDRRLAAWSRKGSVVLVEAGSGRELAQLEDPHQDGMVGFVFSPDGSLIIGSTNDSSCVRVWDLRKIRAGLVELDLDWDAPPYPPAAPAAASPLPLQVTVVGENLFNNAFLMRQSQRERALADLWLNPLDAEARLSLGDALLALGRPGPAEAQFSASLALRPDRLGGCRLRSGARFQQGNWEGCIADAGAALARCPDEPRERWQRGYSLARLGRHAEALPDLTAAVEYYPRWANVYLERAEVYRALNKTAEAGDDWKRAAELVTATNTAEDLNTLAWRLLTGPPAVLDPKRALELAAIATRQRPNDAMMLNTLGLARYRNGLAKEAVQPLERSVQIGRAEFAAHNLFMLAMCHAKLGDSTAARRSFQRAVAAGKDRAGLPEDFAAEIDAFHAEAEATLSAAGIATEPPPPPREK